MVAAMVPAPTMDSQAPRHKEDDHADGATAQVTLDTAVAIAGEVASQDEGGGLHDGTDHIESEELRVIDMSIAGSSRHERPKHTVPTAR